MKHLVYIVSDLNQSIAFEWLNAHLNSSQIKLSFIFLGNQEGALCKKLRELNVEVAHIKIDGIKSYPSVFLSLVWMLKRLSPSVIHTHLRKADLLGLLAAKICGIKRRITTRHSSTFNHKYHPASVKWDRLINYLATDIVAISENVKQVLVDKENVPKNKIHLIHHGFDLEAFGSVSNDRIQLVINKYKIQPDKIKLGVISRLIEWKGVSYIIGAFNELNVSIEAFHLILANANGPLKSEIQNELRESGMTYTFIDFEPDLFALYKTFDVYIHAPIDPEVEAFGQTYVEALASGIPSIFTLSGIAHEFIKHERNALVVDYCNSREIAESILRLMDDKELRERMILNGKQDIQQFNLSTFIDKLENLYLN